MEQHEQEADVLSQTVSTGPPLSPLTAASAESEELLRHLSFMSLPRIRTCIAARSLGKDAYKGGTRDSSE